MKHTSENATIVISTHQVRDLENIIDPIIILDKQEILLNATIEEVSNKLFFDYGTELSKIAFTASSFQGGTSKFARMPPARTAKSTSRLCSMQFTFTKN
jgi:ABC-2 type transport system ATP-binding protein